MIGDRIKSLRIEKGITQEFLAKHLHVSPQAVSKWENNTAYPDITLLIPMADFFGVSVDYLLRENEGLRIEEIASLVEFELHRERKSVSFTGYVKNCSPLQIEELAFKIRFKNNQGQVVDYREECIYNLGPFEMKRIITFSQAAREVVDTEIEILKATAMSNT